jgi:hypothetical protein
LAAVGCGRSLDRLTPTFGGESEERTSSATIGIVHFLLVQQGGPDEHGMWAGFASSLDHLRRVGDRQRGGRAGPVVVARSGAVPPVAERGDRSPRRRRSGRCGRGGMHGVALCREELTAAGFVAHLAEPAETQAKRGRKKRAKSAWNGRLL